MAGVSLAGGVDEASKLVAILESRTLAESVISRENLFPVLYEEINENANMEDAVRRLKQNVVILDDKRSKTIQISGVFLRPEDATRVVNAFVDELQGFINSNSLTVAKRNRVFIKQQLEQNKRELLEAGKELNEFYKKNRISNVDAKVDVSIAVPDLNEEHVMDNGRDELAYLSTRNVDNIATDIDNLARRKKNLEEKIESAKSVKNIPQQVYLNYLIMRRELLAKVSALLTSQYEMAKIEENKEDLAFQVIDRAVVPIQRYSPKRGRFCITIFFVALSFAIFSAFFREYLQKIKSAAHYNRS
jgi:uncharacterized protein involved in exopolysaccharide biosynthesis